MSEDKPRFEVSKRTINGDYRVRMVKKINNHDEISYVIADSLDERTARLFANAEEMAEMLLEMATFDDPGVSWCNGKYEDVICPCKGCELSSKLEYLLARLETKETT